MVTEKLVFTACVHIESGKWRISFRESYSHRSEFIPRSDITTLVTSHSLDQAWDAIDDAGWFVDRVTSRRDSELAMTVATVTPRILSPNFTGEWVFVSRAMARGVPFSVARQGFKDGFSEPVEFAEHYTWEQVLTHKSVDDLHHVIDPH